VALLDGEPFLPGLGGDGVGCGEGVVVRGLVFEALEKGLFDLEKEVGDVALRDACVRYAGVC
jgi:hypothetical protein